VSEATSDMFSVIFSSERLVAAPVADVDLFELSSHCVGSVVSASRYC